MRTSTRITAIIIENRSTQNQSNHMTSIRTSLSLAFMALACNAEPAARTDTSRAGIDYISTPPAAEVPSVSGQGNPPSNPSLPIPAPWTVTEFGIGPLRAGMTVSEAARMVGGSFAAPAGGAQECTYAIWREAPTDVTIMLGEGVVARVDVARASKIATSKGARIGDTETRIKELYQGRVVVTPHEYTDGHYLTVTAPPQSGDDRRYALVFETDGNRVTRYRGGKLPQVGWVEGCS